MHEAEPLAVHEHAVDDLEATLQFLKRTWAELRELRLVRVWPGRLQVIDVNADAFEVRGLGYENAEVVAALNAVHAAFNGDTIHDPCPGEFKEFKTGRRYPWAHDRVM